MKKTIQYAVFFQNMINCMITVVSKEQEASNNVFIFKNGIYQYGYHLGDCKGV